MPKFYKETILSGDYPTEEGIVLRHVLETVGFKYLKLEFISINSPYRQGVLIRRESAGGHLQINDTQAKAFEIWYDTAPRINKILLDKKITHISVFNTWDKGRGPGVFMYKTGMIVEKVAENKYIYRCHDVAEPAEFNKIVFSLELME